MTTIFSTTSTNPHIASLESVFAESPAAIEWLVITHNDARLIRSVSSALSGESAALLQLPQGMWNFEGHDLRETIEWALQQSEIRNLVLVGHSQVGGSASRASLVAPPSAGVNQDEPSANRHSLIGGVQRTTAQIHRARQTFASQVQSMSQIPVVDNRCQSGELTVYGLFYLAESGTFLAYNADEESFHPLMSS